MPTIHTTLPSRTQESARIGIRTGLRLLLVVAVAAVSLFVVPAQPRADASSAWFAAVVDADIILGDGWLPGAFVKITIDDPSNGVGVDHHITRV